MKLAHAVYLFFSAEGVKAFSAASGRNGRRVAFLVPQQQQRRPATTIVLHGILDEINSDSYDLMSSTNPDVMSGKEDLTQAYEIMLAELVFSTNDPRVDIINNFDLATDPDFLEWLEESKINKSSDPEERLALRDLLELIVDIRTKVEVNKLAEERAEQEAVEKENQRMAEAKALGDKGRSMSTAEVLKKATEIQTQISEEELEARKEKKKSFYEQEITPEILLSYENLLKKVLPPYKAGETPSSVAFNYYDQFDAQLVKLLTERSVSGDNDAKALLEALAIEQQKKIASAAEALKSVLAAGDPMRMEGAILRLSREGKTDEAFLLLLEANEQQAKDAGATQPAELMARLRRRAIEEKDKLTQSKEIRLLRQLLRTDDASEREKLLEDAFTPQNALIVPGTMANAQKAVDGELPEQEKPMPDVPPPDFINACKAVLLNFGNLGGDDAERGDLATRIKKLAGEAEVVATRIYGKGMTLREHQDRVWQEQTTSVFDLERMEIEAERQGEVAPWANPGNEEFLMPGFDAQGRMKIGGT